MVGMQTWQKSRLKLVPEYSKLCRCYAARARTHIHAVTHNNRSPLAAHVSTLQCVKWEHVTHQLNEREREICKQIHQLNSKKLNPIAKRDKRKLIVAESSTRDFFFPLLCRFWTLPLLPSLYSVTLRSLEVWRVDHIKLRFDRISVYSRNSLFSDVSLKSNEIVDFELWSEIDWENRFASANRVKTACSVCQRFNAWMVSHVRLYRVSRWP